MRYNIEVTFSRRSCYIKKIIKITFDFQKFKSTMFSFAINCKI